MRELDLFIASLFEWLRDFLDSVFTKEEESQKVIPIPLPVEDEARELDIDEPDHRAHR